MGELNSGLQYVTSSLIVGAVVGLYVVWNRSQFFYSTHWISYKYTDDDNAKENQTKKNEWKLFPAKIVNIDCFRTLGANIFTVCIFS